MVPRTCDVRGPTEDLQLVDASCSEPYHSQNSGTERANCKCSASACTSLATIGSSTHTSHGPNFGTWPSPLIEGSLPDAHAASDNTGKIVGGAVGGAVGAVVLAGTAAFLIRRHTNSSSRKGHAATNPWATAPVRPHGSTVLCIP